MKSENFDIIFLGLVRDCENYIGNFFKTIEEIRKYKKIKVIIGENNSDDFTFDLIQKNLQTNNCIEFIDTTFIEKFSDRIKRLALAREKIKNYIKSKNYQSEFICVVDLDDVISQNFSLNLIEELINQLKMNKSSYFGISVSSKPYYYDILNYESEEFPNRSIKQIQNIRSIFSYNKRKKLIYNVQKKLSLKKSFDCISGFNGLCIYFYEDYINSNYIKNSQIEDPEPEHLFLNRNIHSKTKKKILVTENYFKMPSEHKPLSNFLFFLIEKLLKYILIYKKKIF